MEFATSGSMLPGRRVGRSHVRCLARVWGRGWEYGWKYFWGASCYKLNRLSTLRTAVRVACNLLVAGRQGTVRLCDSSLYLVQAASTLALIGYLFTGRWQKQRCRVGYTETCIFAGRLGFKKEGWFWAHRRYDCLAPPSLPLTARRYSPEHHTL